MVTCLESKRQRECGKGGDLKLANDLGTLGQRAMTSEEHVHQSAVRSPRTDYCGQGLIAGLLTVTRPAKLATSEAKPHVVRTKLGQDSARSCTQRSSKSAAERPAICDGRSATFEWGQIRPQIRPREMRQLASHLGKPGLIPGGVAIRFSHLGIMPGDADGQRVFSGISRFHRPCIPGLLNTHLTLIGSQALDIKANGSWKQYIYPIFYTAFVDHWPSPKSLRFTWTNEKWFSPAASQLRCESLHKEGVNKNR
ncbi:hypothetical protein PR048_003572 [Dryococelus australis]|uniref:Uncharacterized protein n=1 Tax=Dryococelus australis TaxID=614101 RepID=A0ABQ9INH2_9NEOP|nr:hypothetical protein PR048_003572 [Dryococelus australis]